MYATSNLHVQRRFNNTAADLPASTTYSERMALLKKHGHPGTSLFISSKETCPGLHRFLNGLEAITREDSLQISTSLKARLGRQDVKLLHAMQKLDPDFIPCLMLYGSDLGKPDWRDPQERKKFDVEFERNADELCVVLREAAQLGLTFNVDVGGAEPMALRVALALHDVMSSPQCKVKGLQLSEDDDLSEFPETREVLRQCIRDCSTLEWVRSASSAIGLLARGVPTFEITSADLLIDEDEIAEILNRGGTPAVHLTCQDSQSHIVLAKAIRHGNSTLPADLGVRSVKLHDEGAIKKPEKFVLKEMARCMEDLFSTPHLTQLEIPNVAWLARLDPMRAAALIQRSSLQTLSFERNDVESPEGQKVLDQLWPHLQANRDLAFLPLQRAAAVWSSHLLKGEQIDHLAHLVADKLAPSPVDRSIFTNQRKDMREAAAKQSERELAIEAKRKKI
ncbi:hypothetical protein GCM10023165_02740 [Variovorax defluvii]|uniref:Uncharacterized protein n=1 Tax=Variovorax defluvii TaxID=913761 RepID=A0ABP8GTA7_9BURK